MKPTIIVIDRRCIFTECLCEYLTASLPELRVLSVSNAQQAAELAFLPVTCVLVSESCDMSAMRRTFPSASLLLICEGRGSEAFDPEIPKIMLDMPRDVFTEIVRSAARRGCVDALAAVPAPSDHEPPPNSIEDAEEQTRIAACSVRLSGREGEVLAALKRGLPNKLIADEMHLSENTVKIHVRNVMRKLGVTNRTMAALCKTADHPAKVTAPDIAH